MNMWLAQGEACRLTCNTRAQLVAVMHVSHGLVCFQVGNQVNWQGQAARQVAPLAGQNKWQLSDVN